ANLAARVGEAWQAHGRRNGDVARRAQLRKTGTRTCFACGRLLPRVIRRNWRRARLRSRFVWRLLCAGESWCLHREPASSLIATPASVCPLRPAHSGEKLFRPALAALSSTSFPNKSEWYHG